MFGADQIVAHLVGDYILQSHWMATTKTQKGLVGIVAAVIHAVLYTLPFVLITQDWGALSMICWTHYIIDHYRLARYVVWLRNWMAPERNNPWVDCQPFGVNTRKHTGPWLHGWLLIIADNTMHLLINGLVIWWASAQGT